MPYETDYILRLIEQLSSLVRGALERLGLKKAEAGTEIAGRAIGLALGIDPDLAARLSPQSLASLLRLGDLDDRVLELVVQAIDIEAGELQSRGETDAAETRRRQAGAVRSLLRERGRDSSG